LKFFALLPFLLGCKPSSDARGSGTDSSVSRAAAEDPTVMFNLKAVAIPAAGPDTQLYDCTYSEGGKAAKFRLQLTLGSPYKDVPKGISLISAEGKFIAVPGSDNSVLIRDLMTALEAKRSPLNVRRASELPFDAVVLGQNDSRGPDGGLFGKPPGHWTSIKLFLPKGGDDGEVFMNINPVEGKGEFSIKDSDYGDEVVAELARIL
jgi:hypothetical protein